MGKVPETYLYEVRCTRVIKLDCGVEITTPRSLYLTKDDVKKCLQTAYVFRRFADHGLERVTVANLDRLHNATFIPESEWNGTVEEVEPEVVEEVKEEETPVEEPAQEEPVVVAEDPVVEDEKSDTTEESTDTPEEAAELTSANEEVNGVVVDDTVEDVSSDEEAEEDESEDLTTEEDLNVAELEDENDEIGESDHSEESTAHTGAVKYTYKKHHKNKH